MSRKPFKKVKLTNAERDFVMDMVEETRCYWFDLAGYWQDERTGKREHFKSDDYDCVYDTENRRFVSLQYGLSMLMDAYETAVCDAEGLDEEHREMWKRLCAIVNEAYPKLFKRYVLR